MWHAVADPPFLRLLYIQYKFFSKFTILVILSFHRKSFLSRNLITFLSGGEQQRSFTVARFFNWFCLFRFASLTNKIDCKGNILNKISNYHISVKDIPSQTFLSYGSVSAGREKWPFNALFLISGLKANFQQPWVAWDSGQLQITPLSLMPRHSSPLTPWF